MKPSFESFCLKKSTPIHINQISDDTYIPEKYQKILELTINDIKDRVGVFDNVNIAYIEDTIEKTNLKEVLDKNLVNGEVPDGIINELSNKIFNKKFIDLTNSEMAIIKVVTVYICILI